MVLSEDEQDEGLWGDVDSTRLMAGKEESDGESIIYDSWEGFLFPLWCAKCPPKWPNCRSTLNQLLQALDPDGATPRPTRRAVPLPVDNHDIVSLQQMAPENQRHCDQAPRDGEDDDETCTDTTAAVPYERHGRGGLPGPGRAGFAPRQHYYCFRTSTKFHGTSWTLLSRTVICWSMSRTHERHGGMNLRLIARFRATYSNDVITEQKKYQRQLTLFGLLYVLKYEPQIVT